MRRFGRKLDVDAHARPNCRSTPFWFDLLYLNGGALLDEPQARRFAALCGVGAPDALVPHT